MQHDDGTDYAHLVGLAHRRVVLDGRGKLPPTGFFLFFFGVGAVATAFIAVLGLTSFALQGLAFVAISLIGVVSRSANRCSPSFISETAHIWWDSMVGETAKGSRGHCSAGDRKS